MDAIIIIGQSVLKKLDLISILPSSNVIPNTSPRLAILLPITLLKDKSGEPFTAAVKLTINSGADVAKDTTVIPIIIFGMFNFKDKATADLRSQFPPKIKIKKPRIRNKILINCFAGKDTLIPNFYIPKKMKGSILVILKSNFPLLFENDQNKSITLL